MIKTQEFLRYLEAHGARIYNYKRTGYYKAFFGKAYATFDNTQTLSNVLFRGHNPDFDTLRQIVLSFFKTKDIQTYYDEAHDILSTKPFRQITEEEAVRCIEEAYGS